MTAPVELRNASKWYGAVIGLNEVTLEFGPGITGLLGPNGAGKTTLMRLVTGAARPSIGEVLVLGLPVRASPRARRAVGYAPESDGFYEEMDGRGFLEAMARLSGLSRLDARRRAGEVLEEVGMLEAAGKPLRACSKGMRQRIKVGQALVHDPQVVVLDEPLSGIDPVGRADFMALFRRLGEAGKTVIISTHILSEIEDVTDRVALLARGRVLAAGTVSRIRELLDQHPLAVGISSTGARRLAARLLLREEVAGVEVGEDGGDLIARVRRPREFFRALPGLILEAGVEVERIEPLDASAEAIFDYLVGGGAGGGR